MKQTANFFYHHAGHSFDPKTDDASWPNTCIDWDEAARELQYDYFTVEFDGITYWIRS